MNVFQYIQDIMYILQGYTVWFYNWIIHRNSERTKKRLAICKECIHNKHGICQLCGCILKAKVRCDFLEDSKGISIDGCPERKW